MSASGGVMRLPRRRQPMAWTVVEVVVVLLLAVGAVVVLANLSDELSPAAGGGDEEVITTHLTWAERVAAMEDIVPRRRSP